MADLCFSQEVSAIKSKVLSVQKNDLKLLKFLRELIQNQPNIDSESFNLLAASIKEALHEIQSILE